MSERRTEESQKGVADQGGHDMPKIKSEELFGDKSEILIEHNSATYRLRRTSLGKLILTK